jgi:hypothetical protein
MFRSDVSDVTLFDSHKTAGPVPSFRPAVEALEERVVLDNTSCGSAATGPVIDPQAIFTVNQFTSLVQSFTSSLDRALGKFLAKGGGSKDLHKLFNLASNYEILESIIGKVESQVEATHDMSEPFLAQAAAEFHSADSQFASEIGSVATLNAIQKLTNGAANSLLYGPFGVFNHSGSGPGSGF